VHGIDVGDIVVDSGRQAHIAYHYSFVFTGPNNILMEQSHLVVADPADTGFSIREIEIWTQPDTGGLGPRDLRLANDGALRVYVDEPGSPTESFVVGTLGGAGVWHFVRDHDDSIYDVVRAGGAWHAVDVPMLFGSLHYQAGEPGAWTRDEPLTGFDRNSPPRLAVTSTGDVYLASTTQGADHASYQAKLSRRVDATTYATEYDVTTSGGCVFPVLHQPLALPGGGIVVFEDGFNSTQRWLKAHVRSGASWVVEDVADLSFLSNSCSRSTVSWSELPMVTAVDPAGQPHILFASAPWISSTGFEDHFRDATGWHVRRFPIASGHPLAMAIDDNNATHILALAPDFGSTTRIVHVRIDATAWH
jgi:hypothetical protein